MSSLHKLITLLMAAAAVLQLLTFPTAAGELTLPPGTKVDITSNLEVYMQLHCKGDNNDYGTHLVLPGDPYEFIIPPSSTANYDCEFVFHDVAHRFDVYVDERDRSRCGDAGLCSWFVKEGGPCFGDPNSKDNCYHWN